MLLLLTGATNHIYYLDPSHVGKAIKNQIVLSSSVLCMAMHHVDPGLLLLAGVDMDLIRVHDFALDVCVLELCSVHTFK